jgi:hypothetical protein
VLDDGDVPRGAGGVEVGVGRQPDEVAELVAERERRGDGERGDGLRRAA